LGEYRLVKETWRGVLQPATALAPKQLFALPFQRLAATRERINGSAPKGQGAKPAVSKELDGLPLKLYQPAHQRYYLVTSCLVCQLPGLPDRKVDAGKHEQAGFIVRRLLPPNPDPANPPAFDENTWQEYAWIQGADANTWQLADPGEQYVPGEEILPMFGTNYLQDDGRQRRLLAGLVPAGKREAYLAAATAASSAGQGTDISARKILLRTKVIEPWKQLLDRAAKAAHSITGTPNNKSDYYTAIKQARIALQEASYFVLVDFADFLGTYLKPVWDPLVNVAGAVEPTDPAQKAALDALRSIAPDFQSALPSGGTLGTVWQALIGARQQLGSTLVNVFKQLADGSLETALDQAKNAYDPTTAAGVAGYPPFVFPLADPEDDYNSMTGIRAALPQPPTFNPALSNDEAGELKDEQGAEPPLNADQTLDQFAVVLIRALATVPATAPQPAVPLAAKPAADPLTGWFVIRCVYRRPACGPLHQDVVSTGRSEAFQLAGFFDPDAPARPIRIGLPVDTSPAGLRKFDKNTAFVLSDMLCGHVKLAKVMTL
jgi:hypothetical protein